MEQSNDNAAVVKTRRWGRWIGFSFLALIVFVIAGHAIWGGWQEKKLGEEIAALRAKGEPLLMQEMANRAVPENENATILLRQAGEAIDVNTEAWRQLDELELGLPLSENEVAIVRRAVEENRNALAKLRQARPRSGVDWQIDCSIAPSF